MPNESIFWGRACGFWRCAEFARSNHQNMKSNWRGSNKNGRGEKFFIFVIVFANRMRYTDEETITGFPMIVIGSFVHINYSVRNDGWSGHRINSILGTKMYERRKMI